eukprot:677763_1
MNRSHVNNTNNSSNHNTGNTRNTSTKIISRLNEVYHQFGIKFASLRNEGGHIAHGILESYRQIQELQEHQHTLVTLADHFASYILYLIYQTMGHQEGSSNNAHIYGLSGSDAINTCLFII